MILRVIRSSTCAAVSMLLGLVTASTASEQDGSTRAPTCQLAGPLVRVAELNEGSGVAASRQSSGRLFAHNDSGEPVLFVLDSKGTVVGRLRVPGAAVEDWEAVGVGPCPSGSCIYLGDIGDNKAKRRDVTIYRVPEPADVSGAVARADVFRARYPDKAQDAETLLVTPNGDILIVTKGETGPVALYRVPSDAKPGGSVTLQPVGKPRQAGRTADERITDGAVSPGGEWVALRTKTAIVLFRTADLVAGNWREAGRVPLEELGEPQGEGIAFGDDNTVYLVGEGGGKSRPGTFARLTCALSAGRIPA